MGPEPGRITDALSGCCAHTAWYHDLEADVGTLLCEVPECGCEGWRDEPVDSLPPTGKRK